MAGTDEDHLCEIDEWKNSNYRIAFLLILLNGGK
jgi:hypothetical protein